MFFAFAFVLIASGTASADPILGVSYSISPDNYTAQVGESVQYSAHFYINGSDIPTNFSWYLKPVTGTASINSNGLLVATGVGDVIVGATDPANYSIETTLHIVNNSNYFGTPVLLQISAQQTTSVAGVGIQLTATAFDANGNSIVPNNTVWTLWNGPGYVNTSGYFISYGNGSSIVMASYSGLSASIALNTVPGEISKLVLKNQNELYYPVAGWGYKLSVYAQDEYNNNVSTPPVSFTVENTSGTGEIVISGNESYFVGYLAGEVRIIATAKTNSSISTTFEVEVVPGAPVIMELRSDSGLFKLHENEQLQLSLYAEDEFGNVLDEQYIVNPSWSITNKDGQATITSKGLLTATKVGSVTVSVSLAYAGAKTSHAISILPKQENVVLSLPAGSFGEKPADGSAAAISAFSDDGAGSSGNGLGAVIGQASGSATGFFTLGVAPNLFWLVIVGAVLVLCFFFIRSRAHGQANENPHYNEKSLREYLLSKD